MSPLQRGPVAALPQQPPKRAVPLWAHRSKARLISHPRLPNGALFVRCASDVQWLEDQRYIEIREPRRRKRGFTLELTEQAHTIKRDAPRDVI